MATTTNYGWTTPDDTALVKDGASAIRTLGSSVDTTTKNLNPETTLGDISFRSSTSNVNTRLGIGSSGQVLTVAAGVPSWATPTDQTPLTTKGDLFTFSTVDARLAVGTNGQVLTADSAEATGLKFATPASGGMTLLASGALSSSSTTYNVITTGYVYLQIFMTNVYASADNNIIMRINGDTGSNYGQVYETSGPTSTKTPSATSYRLTNGSGTSDDTKVNANAFIQIFDPNSASQMSISHQGMCGPSGDMRFNVGNGNYDSAAAITSILFLIQSGTFSQGSVSIYGVK